VNAVGTRWRRRGAVLGAAWLGALGLGHGCGGPPPPAPPSWLAEPIAAPTAAPTAAPVVAVPAALADPSQPTFDPASVVPLLDDPRLAEVKALVAREAHKGAAEALEELIAKRPPSAEELPRWWYQVARLGEEAGLPGLALRAYDRAAESEWPLADHARFLAADIYVAIDKPGEALSRLGRIPTGTALDDEVALSRARALAASRNVDDAAVLWRAYLGRRPLPQDWQLVALRFAKALLQQPSVEHAEEAVRVARRVIYESPGGRGVMEARELEQQALGTLPNDRRAPLVKPEMAELVARARELGGAAQPREALAAVDKLFEALGSDEAAPGEASCEAYIAKGRGLDGLKRYVESSEAYGLARARCEGHERLVLALFLGGRAALRAGDEAEARQRYALLEQKFPAHSYADDARFHGAQAARQMGDLAAFTRMLLAIGEAYPDGDMVDEALFALAQDRIEENDWAGALGPLERAVQKQERGRPYWAEGRPQYFLARARLELGDRARGEAGLAAVIRGFPLSYYMLLAYARLEASSPGAGRRVVEEAMAAEPRGDFVIPDHPDLHEPAFLRAVELVRQGDGRRALAELETLGVRDKSARPELLWASAFLLARIDAPAESHGLLRSHDLWRQHFPAGVWRPIWEVAYPRPFLPIVEREAPRFAVPQHLAYAVMREESAFMPRVVSRSDAYGLMQLILPTARRQAEKIGLVADASSLKRPEVNIPLGCRYLSILKQRFAFNPVLAIPGYNAGPGAPEKWLDESPAAELDVWVERIPYKETREYTKRVLQSLAAYAVLYGGGMEDDLVHLPLAVSP
jgi:soluble lytic murein transglycosylase